MRGGKKELRGSRFGVRFGGQVPDISGDSLKTY